MSGARVVAALDGFLIGVIVSQGWRTLAAYWISSRGSLAMPEQPQQQNVTEVDRRTDLSKGESRGTFSMTNVESPVPPISSLQAQAQAQQVASEQSPQQAPPQTTDDF
jgi:hypothetical protein